MTKIVPNLMKTTNTVQRQLVNTKHKKHEENYNKANHNQIVQNLWQNTENSWRKKDILHEIEKKDKDKDAVKNSSSETTGE